MREQGQVNLKPVLSDFARRKWGVIWRLGNPTEKRAQILTGTGQNQFTKDTYYLYFRRFLGRIENWSQKSYKNTEIDLDRLGLNQSKKIEAGRSDNEIRIKPQSGQWHQVPFGISSSPHSQRTCQKADA